MKFTRKPTAVKAVQVKEINKEPDGFGCVFSEPPPLWLTGMFRDGSAQIRFGGKLWQFNFGVQTAYPGDWVVYERGEVRVFKDSVFRELFQGAPPVRYVPCDFCDKPVDTGKLHVTTGTGYAHDECWRRNIQEVQP